MSARHAIIDDTEFWSRLEYAATDWLASSVDKRIRASGLLLDLSGSHEALPFVEAPAKAKLDVRRDGGEPAVVPITN